MPLYLAKSQRFQSPGHYTKADRDKIKQDSPEDFAGPHESFPIKTAQDVTDAARLAGKAKNPGGVRAKIKAIARRKKLPLPASWAHEAPARTHA
jgi:hypothetical protein